MIIDSPQFQRLRELHQLGTGYLVFPTGNHKRFEHSLGVYYLCGLILQYIKFHSQNNPEELKNAILAIPELQEISPNGELTDENIEDVKIAGLCHDLGHGPFSHVFDDIFLEKHENNYLEEHENRSGFILEYIIKSKNIPICEKRIK